MTAKSRVRKSMRKLRRSTDVTPHPSRSFKASDPAEAKRVEELLEEVSRDRAQKTVRAEATSDATPDVERRSPSTSGHPAEAHLIFFEAELNGQPAHIESQACYCDIPNHHWKELGEL